MTGKDDKARFDSWQYNGNCTMSYEEQSAQCLEFRYNFMGQSSSQFQEYGQFAFSFYYDLVP